MLFSALDDLVWTKFKQKRQQVSNISVKKTLLFKELCSSVFFTWHSCCRIIALTFVTLILGTHTEDYSVFQASVLSWFTFP